MLTTLLIDDQWWVEVLTLLLIAYIHQVGREEFFNGWESWAEPAWRFFHLWDAFRGTVYDWVSSLQHVAISLIIFGGVFARIGWRLEDVAGPAGGAIIGLLVGPAVVAAVREPDEYRIRTAAFVIWFAMIGYGWLGIFDAFTGWAFGSVIGATFYRWREADNGTLDTKDGRRDWLWPVYAAGLVWLFCGLRIWGVV
jgi:hypothetical protein